jgi:hypothetical protein
MNFADRLAQLKGSRLTSVTAVEYESPPREEIYAVGTQIRISDGTVLDAQFWRLLKEAHPRISIFDHRQQYGLPSPIDAVSVLRDEVTDKKIVDATMNAAGDLLFLMEGDLTLEIFNFTAFEIWEVTFSDGTSQLSNYAFDGGTR